MPAPAQYLHQLHLAMTSMPSELEVRASGQPAGGQGVWTRLRVEAGRRFGPFLGNWTTQPVHEQFAWEVSTFCLPAEGQCQGRRRAVVSSPATAAGVGTVRFLSAPSGRAADPRCRLITRRNGGAAPGSPDRLPMTRRR